MNPGFSLAELAKYIDAELVGDGSYRVLRLTSLQAAQANCISFVTGKAYSKYLGASLAGAMILSPELAPQFPGNKLVHVNPYLAYARLSRLFDNHSAFAPGVHLTAVVDGGAVLGANVTIGARAVIATGAVLGNDVVVGAGSVIGAGARVGDRTRLEANVTLYHSVVIGEDCLIHSGAVIGSDGFGFAPDGEAWEKIHQLGRVIVGNRVEIGANVAIDRGALDDTTIADGVKIDNLVHIAHNVQIGQNTAIAAQTGFAGSVRVGERCTFGGQVGVSGHLNLADRIHIGGKSMVTGSLKEAGAYASGTALLPIKEWRKSAVRFRQLDDFATRIKKLEKALQQKDG